MDKIYDLAKNIVNTTYEKLPPDVSEITKKLIIDALAVGLCGSKEAGVIELIEILKHWGGKKESTIWVYGGKLPCLSAAQVNATMVHASDYDDTHDPSPVHTGVACVPTAIAIAEIIRGINGKKLITAIALGVDLMVRLCMACKIPMIDMGWHYTALHGNFGAAAVAGKLLELDEEKLINAFGLAYHQAAGNMQCIHDGNASLAKRMGPGFAVRNGILAVLLAKKNITGARNSLEGIYGLFNVYCKGEYNPEVLTTNLGERYGITDLSFKPYPCVRNAHPPIDAIIEMTRENKIKTEDIEVITVHGGSRAMKSLCEPLDIKRNPRSVVDAQFSIPWTVAAACVRGTVDLDSFTDKTIKDKRILTLSNKVIPKIDDSLSTRAVSPAIVEVKLKDGKVYSKRVDDPYGSPKNPMSMEAIFEKFKNCASYAKRPMPKTSVEKLIHGLADLENIRDIGKVVRILGGSK